MIGLQIFHLGMGVTTGRQRSKFQSDLEISHQDASKKKYLEGSGLLQTPNLPLILDLNTSFAKLRTISFGDYIFFYLSFGL